MNKSRIFLGSSGKQARLLQAITRGLEDVVDVEPWTTTSPAEVRAINRRRARHPAHVHPPRERFEAAERPEASCASRGTATVA